MISLNYPNIDFNEFDIHTALNGNLIFIGSSIDLEYEDKRKFYILKEDGRGYFSNQLENEEYATYIFGHLSSSKTYGNSFSLKMGDQYVVWIITPNNILEIYDFDIYEKYEYNATEMLESYNYTQHISS